MKNNIYAGKYKSMKKGQISQFFDTPGITNLTRLRAQVAGIQIHVVSWNFPLYYWKIDWNSSFARFLEGWLKAVWLPKGEFADSEEAFLKILLETHYQSFEKSGEEINYCTHPPKGQKTSWKIGALLITRCEWHLSSASV